MTREGLPARQPDHATSEESSDDPVQAENRQIPGITGELMLRGWSCKGLFGYMWLHGGLFHLGGNLLFLWIFGNAVCAKLGNLRYCVLYVSCGVAAGIVHLLFAPGPVLGASGAINGVVGMYLVLFYENEITCLFACSCGKEIKVPAKYAGRSGKCPQCGSRLKIPPAVT